MWANLHRRATDYTGDGLAEALWLVRFARRIGCGVCKIHWTELVAKMPPDLADAAAYWRWTVDAHNAVNVRLGKPVWEPLQLTRATSE